MGKIYLRAANIFKVISMILFVGCLALIYGYEPDFIRLKYFPGDISDFVFSKKYWFYGNLIAFVIVNLSLSLMIYFIKVRVIVDDHLSFFRTAYHKEIVLVWLTVVIACVNICLALIYSYVGIVNISGIAHAQNYRFMPVVGVIILFFSLFGLLAVLINLWRSDRERQ